MASRRSRVMAAVVALGLGLWSGLGGCLTALGSLGQGETPDNPFLNAEQQRAFATFVEAGVTWEPVTAALSALSTLLLPLMIVAAISLLAQRDSAALIARAAFGASLVIDGLHLVWGVVWTLLLWGPMGAYVQAIARSLPDRTPEMVAMTDGLVLVTVLVTVLMSALYFAVKMALAAWAMRASGDTPPDEGSPPAPRQRELDPNLSWAVDP